MSDIRTRPATKEYRDNYDKVFGAKKKRSPGCRCGHNEQVHARTGRWCLLCSCKSYVARGKGERVVSDAAKATSADIRRRLKETP